MAEMISVVCSICGKTLRVNQAYLGKSIKCPCGQKLRMPDAETKAVQEYEYHEEFDFSGKRRPAPGTPKLILCPDCNQSISSRASHCPHCGCPIQQNTYGSERSLAHEFEKMQLRQKSFTTPAVITFVLYCIGWVPGLFVNFMYLDEAKKVKAATRQKPEGYGCLVAMLIMLGIIPGIVSVGLLLYLFVMKQ